MPDNAERLDMAEMLAKGGATIDYIIERTGVARSVAQGLFGRFNVTDPFNVPGLKSNMLNDEQIELRKRNMRG